MLKREIVWRQIADDVLEDRRTTFHQRELAAKLGMSPGNVHLALEPLRAVGAARRPPSRPLAAFTSMEHARDLGRVLPPGLALTSFAGFVARYGDEPAPFSVARAYVRPDDDATLVELRRPFNDAPDGGAP